MLKLSCSKVADGRMVNSMVNRILDDIEKSFSHLLFLSYYIHNYQNYFDGFGICHTLFLSSLYFIGPFNVKDKGKAHLFVWSNKIEVLRNPYFKFELNIKKPN